MAWAAWLRLRPPLRSTKPEPVTGEPATGGAATCGERRGRPRSIEADEAILGAALRQFADCGYEGVSVEAVAAEAGVAKSTIYRRYPTKADLLGAAAEHASERAGVATADTGSVERDLLTLACKLRDALRSTEFGRSVPAVVAAAARHPEMAQMHREFIARRRRGAVAAVRRGIERGELGPDTDPDLLVDLVVGPVFYRLFLSGTPTTDAWLSDLVARAVRAYA